MGWYNSWYNPKDESPLSVVSSQKQLFKQYVFDVQKSKHGWLGDYEEVRTLAGFPGSCDLWSKLIYSANPVDSAYEFPSVRYLDLRAYQVLDNDDILWWFVCLRLWQNRFVFYVHVKQITVRLGIPVTSKATIKHAHHQILNTDGSQSNSLQHRQRDLTYKLIQAIKDLQTAFNVVLCIFSFFKRSHLTSHLCLNFRYHKEIWHGLFNEANRN